jgi:hypothetical protein
MALVERHIGGGGGHVPLYNSKYILVSFRILS